MFISSAYAETVEMPAEHAGEAAQHADRVFPPFFFVFRVASVLAYSLFRPVLYIYVTCHRTSYWRYY